MSDAACVELLQWALPRLGWRWRGFRNVRGQVCKRIGRRIAALGLTGVDAYRARLEGDPAEWHVLDGLCGITISRFYRDRRVWDALREEVLPALAEAAVEARAPTLRCWSLGCASGEEPYTVAIVWRIALAHRFPGLRLEVLGTDFDEAMLGRARAARYAPASLRELPADWRERAFERDGELLRLRDAFRADVALERADVRERLPDGRFDLILCRNLVFTYFDEPQQSATLLRLATKGVDGGALVLGRHEQLPPGASLVPWQLELGIFRWPAAP